MLSDGIIEVAGAYMATINHSSAVPTYLQDLRHQEIAERAAQHGLRSVPAVVIDGKLAGCCANRRVDENVLREALT